MNKIDKIITKTGGTQSVRKKKITSLQGPNVSSKVIYRKGMSNLLSRLIK